MKEPDGDAVLAELRRRAARSPRRIGFPEAEDARTRQAVSRLAAEGLVRPVVFGDPDLVSELYGDMEGVERRSEIATAGKEGVGSDPLAAAATLLVDGKLDGVVAGASYRTADVIRTGLRLVGLAPGIVTVSSSFFMILRRPTAAGHQVLTFTDPAVAPLPTAAQVAESADLASRAHVDVVGDEPRVAFLSYSTRGSAGGEGVEKMRHALELFRQRRPEVLADGELQVDAALVPGVGRRKAPDSPVAGSANVLVFPDLGAANIGYKLVERLAGARALGPILQGLRRSLNDLSRGAAPEDIVHVACITALQAASERGRELETRQDEGT